MCCNWSRTHGHCFCGYPAVSLRFAKCWLLLCIRSLFMTPGITRIHALLVVPARQYAKPEVPQLSHLRVHADWIAETLMQWKLSTCQNQQIRCTLSAHVPAPSSAPGLLSAALSLVSPLPQAILAWLGKLLLMMMEDQLVVLAPSLLTRCHLWFPVMPPQSAAACRRKTALCPKSETPTRLCTASRVEPASVVQGDSRDNQQACLGVYDCVKLASCPERCAPACSDKVRVQP